MPLISVIIPAYNSEKTIRDTIKSVINQTCNNFEIIVINDGSQDSTLEIVSQFSDPRLKVFSYPNAGGAVSRNRGFSHSSGEFIAFLDADDLWTPDKLELQLTALQENPEAAVAYSWMDCIDESGKFFRPGSHRTENGDIYAKLFLTCFVETGSNPMIRRQAFIEVNGFDETLSASQDYELYLRLASRYNFVAVPHTQVLYRLSSNSMTCNIKRHEETSVLVRERTFNKAEKPLPRNLKQHSLANFYKDFTFRVLDMSANPSRGLEAGRLLSKAVKYDPSLIKKRVFWKVLLKIGTMLLLPPKLSQYVINKKKNLYNVSALFQYMKIDPFN
ncbi:glycosyltransferase family 2 protein [Aerosakkonemataceae cyanobacterium BLCC-F154]|uniref:Glycosyltransferase family 2 protein n=1 Tax=Floridaenema fluviatile BLCC-F154 TaxID=3153640 RepID=A0ABV4YGM0_9CYAN